MQLATIVEQLKKKEEKKLPQLAEVRILTQLLQLP